MRDFVNNYRSRVLSDFAIFCVALLPAISAFYLDFKGHTTDAFLRSGAIMALFGAFLEFRTHEIQALRDRDNFHRLWSTIGTLTEGLAKVDRATKYSLRSISVVISASGMKPDIGEAEEIKDMIVTDRIKALKYLPLVPGSYYTYSKYTAIAGKSLVVCGTLIWAFGDFAIKLCK